MAAQSGAVTQPPQAAHVAPTTPMSPNSQSMSGGANSNRFGQFSRSAFFARHNPHPCRVRHIKGLLDCPVCYVNDDGYEPEKFVWRDLYSHRDLPGDMAPPSPNAYAENSHQPATPGPHHHHHSMVQHLPPRMPVFSINLGNVHQKLNPDTIRGLQNFTGLRNYSFKEKADPKLGVLTPVTDNWRYELRALTEAAMQAVIEKRQQAAADREQQLQASLKHPATWLKAGPQQSSPSVGLQQYSQKTGRLLTPSMSRPSTTPSRPRSIFGEIPSNQRPPTNRDVIETRAAPLSRGSGLSRSCSRGGENCYYDPQGAMVHTVATPQGGYEHIFHAQDPELEVFSMLCGILQTDDTNAVRAWLSSASQREKALVLDIVQASMLHRDEYYAMEGKNKLPAINENEEAHNKPQAPQGDSSASEVNRLVVHEDNETPVEQVPPKPEETIVDNPAAYRPISPQKKADAGNRRQSKRASSVKGIPQPVWRPDSSLVN